MGAIRDMFSKNLRQGGILVAFVAIVAVFAVWTDGKLLDPGNISNLVLQFSYILILAIGMLFVIVVGHIDLSVGSVVALVGAVAATLVIKNGMPWWVGVLIGAAMVFFGTCGDLIESAIKRDVGIKDMSSILPGHGGVMDRLDSLVFASPVAYTVLALPLT